MVRKLRTPWKFYHDYHMILAFHMVQHTTGAYYKYVFEIGIFDSRYYQISCDIENTLFSTFSTKVDEWKPLLPHLWMLCLISTSLPYLTHSYCMIPICQHAAIAFWDSSLWCNSLPCLYISITNTGAFPPPAFSYPTFSQWRISVESMLIGSNRPFF